MLAIDPQVAVAGAEQLHVDRADLLAVARAGLADRAAADRAALARDLGQRAAGRGGDRRHRLDPGGVARGIVGRVRAGRRGQAQEQGQGVEPLHRTKIGARARPDQFLVV